MALLPTSCSPVLSAENLLAAAAPGVLLDHIHQLYLKRNCALWDCSSVKQCTSMAVLAWKMCSSFKLRCYNRWTPNLHPNVAATSISFHKLSCILKMLFVSLDHHIEFLSLHYSSLFFYVYLSLNSSFSIMQVSGMTHTEFQMNKWEFCWHY